MLEADCAAIVILVFLAALQGFAQLPPSVDVNRARIESPSRAPIPVQAPQFAQQDPVSGRAVEPPVLSPRQREETRADILMARKLYPEALEVYQKLSAAEPKNAALLNKIGIAHYQQSQLDLAKRYYDRALKFDRNFASAISNVGTVYYDRKSYRKAIQFYKRALALQPQMSGVHSNLGYAYFAQKKYEEALAAFQRALELDPEIFEHRSRFGSLLQHRSVHDRALFYFFMAKTYASRGNAEQCASYLKKARAEGYKDFAKVEKDPVFAPVLKDPLVQEALRPEQSVTAPPSNSGL